jgi:hypothetical protein
MGESNTIAPLGNFQALRGYLRTQRTSEHEREARTKGIPSLGSGRVFPIAEDAILCESDPDPRALVSDSRDGLRLGAPLCSDAQCLGPFISSAFRFVGDMRPRLAPGWREPRLNETGKNSSTSHGFLRASGEATALTSQGLAALKPSHVEAQHRVSLTRTRPSSGKPPPCQCSKGRLRERPPNRLRPHSAPTSRSSPKKLERAMGIEPTTRSLGSYCSTTELHPRPRHFYHDGFFAKSDRSRSGDAPSPCRAGGTAC